MHLLFCDSISFFSPAQITTFVLVLIRVCPTEQRSALTSISMSNPEGEEQYLCFVHDSPDPEYRPIAKPPDNCFLASEERSMHHSSDKFG